MGKRLGIIIVRQAGSAAGLAPVADDMVEQDPDCTVVIIAFPQAIGTCREAARHPDRYTVYPVATEEEARQHFERDIQTANFLLTGTSFEAEADAWYWRSARRIGVEACAYLDQWANIEQRFPGSTRNDWPDRLAVIDEHDKQLALAIAPPGVAIHVTGSPALENIKRQVQALREQGVTADPDRIVFATEPVGDPQSYKAKNGFHDEDSFDLALKLIRKWHRQATLVIRLHPRDTRGRWLARLPDDIRIEWDDSTRAQALARAGIVFGMRSFFLLEALTCGVRVYSLQPGRKTACPLTDGRMPVIVDESEYS